MMAAQIAVRVAAHPGNTVWATAVARVLFADHPVVFSLEVPVGALYLQNGAGETVAVVLAE